MLLNPYRFGSAPEVIYRGYGPLATEDANTSIIVSPPPLVVVGDLLVVFLMRRGTMTPPAGWTRVSTAGPVTNGAGNAEQFTDVYTKIAAAPDIGATVTFTQAVNIRLQAQMINLYATLGVPTLESQNTAMVSSVTREWIDLPAISSLGNGRLGVAMASSMIAQVSGVSVSSIDNGWSMQTATPANQLRIAGATKALANGANTTGQVTFGGAVGGLNGLTAHSLIFYAA